jgi:hypothetical protein
VLPEETESQAEAKASTGINKENLKSKSFKVAFQPKFKKTTSKTKKIAAEKIDEDLDFNKMSLGDEVIEKKAEKSATKNPFKFEEESKNEPETKKIEKSLPLDASKLKNVSGFGSDDIGCTDSPG